MKFMTDDGEVSEAFCDGYSFGDRLLEGVMFHLKIIEGKVVCTGVHISCKGYMERFSEKKIAEWKETAASESYQDGYTDQTGRVDIWVEDIE